MTSSSVNIDFEKMQTALKLFARKRAEKAGSNIIYIQNGKLIKENPKTHQKTILKSVSVYS